MHLGYLFLAPIAVIFFVCAISSPAVAQDWLDRLGDNANQINSLSEGIERDAIGSPKAALYYKECMFRDVEGACSELVGESGSVGPISNWTRAGAFRKRGELKEARSDKCGALADFRRALKYHSFPNSEVKIAKLAVDAGGHCPDELDAAGIAPEPAGSDVDEYIEPNSGVAWVTTIELPPLLSQRAVRPPAPSRQPPVAIQVVSAASPPASREIPAAGMTENTAERPLETAIQTLNSEPLDLSIQFASISTDSANAIQVAQSAASSPVETSALPVTPSVAVSASIGASVPCQAGDIGAQSTDAEAGCAAAAVNPAVSTVSAHRQNAPVRTALRGRNGAVLLTFALTAALAVAMFYAWLSPVMAALARNKQLKQAATAAREEDGFNFRRVDHVLDPLETELPPIVAALRAAAQIETPDQAVANSCELENASDQSVAAAESELQLILEGIAMANMPPAPPSDLQAVLERLTVTDLPSEPSEQSADSQMDLPFRESAPPAVEMPAQETARSDSILPPAVVAPEVTAAKKAPALGELSNGSRLLELIAEGSLGSIQRGAATILVLDGEGRLTEQIRRSYPNSGSTQAPERLLMIEPSGRDCGGVLNPFSCAISDADPLERKLRFNGIFEQHTLVFETLFGASFTQDNRVALRHFARLLHALPGANFRTWHDLLEPENFQRLSDYASLMDHAETQWFFKSAARDRSALAFAESLRTKISQLLAHPDFEHLTCGDPGGMTLERHINEGRLIVFTPDVLQLGTVQCSGLAGTYLSLISSARQQTAACGIDRVPVCLLVENARTLFGAQTSELEFLLRQISSGEVSIIRG